MNWDKVLTTKCYTPPIRPNIKSIGDTRNFDAKILKEEILDTEDPPSNQKPLKRSMTLNMWNKMHLTDFTYAEEDQDITGEDLISPSPHHLHTSHEVIFLEDIAFPTK